MPASSERHRRIHRRLKWLWLAQVPVYAACFLDAVLFETWGVGIWWDEYRITMLSLSYIALVSITTAAEAEWAAEEAS